MGVTAICLFDKSSGFVKYPVFYIVPSGAGSIGFFYDSGGWREYSICNIKPCRNIVNSSLDHTCEGCLEFTVIVPAPLAINKLELPGLGIGILHYFEIDLSITGIQAFSGNDYCGCSHIGVVLVGHSIISSFLEVCRYPWPHP